MKNEASAERVTLSAYTPRSARLIRETRVQRYADWVPRVWQSADENKAPADSESQAQTDDWETTAIVLGNVFI